jgi:hypothetical protein
MTVFDKHQLNIARKTLRMSDLAIKALGGMTREEARQIITKLTGRKWIKQ